MLRFKEEDELLETEKEEYMELVEKLKNNGPNFVCGDPGTLSLEALRSLSEAMEIGRAIVLEKLKKKSN